MNARIRTLPRGAAYVFLLAAVLFVPLGHAQSTDTKDYIPGKYSTWDVSPFIGFQRLLEIGNARNAPNLNFQGQAQALGHGVILGARVTQDLSNYVGLEEGFTWGRSGVSLNPAGSGSNEAVSFDMSTYQLSIGPVLNFRPRQKRMRPFVMAGAAANWFNPERKSVGPLTYQLAKKVTGAFVWGGGVKIMATSRLGLRFDVRNVWSSTPHFNLPTLPSESNAYFSPLGTTTNALQVSFGVVFGFRTRSDEPPPPPPAAPAPPPPPVNFSIDSISGARDVCPGEPVELRAATTGVPSDATYEWTVNGQPAGGTGPTVSLPTAGRSGAQNASLKITAGGVTKTSDSVSFRIREAAPPKITVAVSPTSLNKGDRATIDVAAKGSECGGDVRTSLAASEGSISGSTYDSSTVSFDPNATKPQSKTVTITGTATDSKGATATSTAQVTVNQKLQARRLDDIVFARNGGRVNNCGKRLLLEELTPLLRDNPDAQVVLVGHRDEQERGAAARRLDRVRALNAAAVLSAGKGICPQLELNRIRFQAAGTDQSSAPRPGFCGASTNVKERRGQGVGESDSRAQFRRVEVWFIPAGAEMPDAVKSAAELPAREVKRLGCPR